MKCFKKTKIFEEQENIDESEKIKRKNLNSKNNFQQEKEDRYNFISHNQTNENEIYLANIIGKND